MSDKNIENIIRLAEIAYSREQYDECLSLCERALESIRPNDERRQKLLHMLSDVYADLGRYSEAISTLSILLESWQSSVAYANRGWALMELKRWDEARLDYEKALSLAPIDLAAATNLAECLLELDLPLEAVRHLRKYTTTRQQQGRLYRMLGESLLRIKNIEDAYSAFTIATDLNGEDELAKSRKKQIEHAAE